MKQVHVLPLLVTIVPAIAQTGAFTYLGCYSDDPSARGLTGQSNAVPADQNSIETCAAACTAYTYFGVEWSVECYCGNTINPPSTLQAGSSGDATGCGMSCQGNSSEICGGGLRVSIYQNTNSGSSSSSSATTSLTTSGISSSSSAIAPSSTSPASVLPSSVLSSNAPSSNIPSSNVPSSSGKPSTFAIVPASPSNVPATSGTPPTSTPKASTPNSPPTSAKAPTTSSALKSSSPPPSSKVPTTSSALQFSSPPIRSSTSSAFLTSTKLPSSTAPKSSATSSAAAAVSSSAVSGSSSLTCQRLNAAFDYLDDEIAMFKQQGISVPPYLAGIISAFQTAQKAAGCT